MHTSEETLLSKNLVYEIREGGYETPAGKIKFPKPLRDKFRLETGDYRSDEKIIIGRMILIYNSETEWGLKQMEATDENIDSNYKR